MSTFGLVLVQDGLEPGLHLVICHGQSGVVRKQKRTLPKNRNDEVETYVLIIHLIL